MEATKKKKKKEPRPRAYTHMLGANRPQRAHTGTWRHVQGPSHACTRRIGGNRPAKPRGATSRALHTYSVSRGRNGPVQPRGVTSRGLHTCAQGVHAENRPKSAGTGPLSPVRGPTHTCTGYTGRNGPLLAREGTSMGLHSRVHGAQDETVR